MKFQSWENPNNYSQVKSVCISIQVFRLDLSHDLRTGDMCNKKAALFPWVCVSCLTQSQLS